MPSGASWRSTEPSSRIQFESEPKSSDRPTVFRVGVVDHQNRDKALADVAYGLDGGVVLHDDRFAGVDQLRTGRIIEVGGVKGTPARRATGLRVSSRSKASAAGCQARSANAKASPAPSFANELTHCPWFL